MISLEFIRRLAGAAGLLLLAAAFASCQSRAKPPQVALAPTATSQVTSQDTPAPTATIALSPTPTVTASSTPTPTRTPTQVPTATPTPLPQAIQLTTGGCCTQLFWSPDSQQVRFIDKPDNESPVGIWGAPVSEPQTTPILVSERLELSSAQPDFLVETSGDTTTVERLADGERWIVPAEGRTVSFSPDRTRIAWATNNSDLPPEEQVTTIWVSGLDGVDARQIKTLPRGGLNGWISEDALLISGRESLQARESWLAALSLADGSVTELARAERLRSPLLSPSGEWLVYYTTFDADPSKNGLWLVRTDGSERRQLDHEVFGAYQWRKCSGDCGPDARSERLLIVPFDPNAAFHRFLELDPATGIVRELTSPEITPFKIANGDWRVSPDGRYVAFVESSDRNIWMIDLPD